MISPSQRVGVICHHCGQLFPSADAAFVDTIRKIERWCPRCALRLDKAFRIVEDPAKKQETAQTSQPRIGRPPLDPEERQLRAAARAEVANENRKSERRLRKAHALSVEHSKRKSTIMRAACSCGWRGWNVNSEEQAMEEFKCHVKNIIGEKE